MARGGATEVGSPPGGRIGHGALGEDLVREYLDAVRERGGEDSKRGGCVGGGTEERQREGGSREQWRVVGREKGGRKSPLGSIGDKGIGRRERITEQKARACMCARSRACVRACACGRARFRVRAYVSARVCLPRECVCLRARRCLCAHTMSAGLYGCRRLGAGCDCAVRDPSAGERGEEEGEAERGGRGGGHGLLRGRAGRGPARDGKRATLRAAARAAAPLSASSACAGA